MLGYIHSATRGTTNAILARVADRADKQGLRVTGLIQARGPQGGAHPCDMDLRCLPDGPVFAIAQRLGTGSQGCRMDLAALEQAAQAVSARIEKGADLLIINKFGAQESQGRGFVPAIVNALDRGIAVLTVVNPQNIDGFRAFAGNLATELPPDHDAILSWVVRTTDAVSAEH